jgi:hypothetical protein
MDWKSSYVHGKLRETIYSLAVGPGDIRKRLVQVYSGFFTLKKEQFPLEIQSDWEWIMKELKKYGPLLRDDGSIFRGSVEHTCSRIKNKTGVKIATRLLDIFQYLDLHKN